jgi:hypothetical protein
LASVGPILGSGAKPRRCRAAEPFEMKLQIDINFWYRQTKPDPAPYKTTWKLPGDQNIQISSSD